MAEITEKVRSRRRQRHAPILEAGTHRICHPYVTEMSMCRGSTPRQVNPVSPLTGKKALCSAAKSRMLIEPRFVRSNP